MVCYDILTTEADKDVRRAISVEPVQKSWR